jgi:sensor histidine kinase YesM
VLPVRRIRETANLLFTIVNFIVGQFYIERRNSKLLNEQRLQEEITRRRDDLEVLMLHSQSAPHFLFNALNAAGRQAHMEGAQKTEDVIYALADMCRHVMRISDPSVTIEQELQSVKNYMFIQKARFGDLLSFDLRVEPDIMNCLVPSLSIQTLIENAMRHGIERKNDLGHVRVRGFKEGGNICFEITDNGAGMTKDRMKLLNDFDKLEKAAPNFSGSGIYNLYKKLRYFWKDDFKLRFSENQGGGVTVMLELTPRMMPADIKTEQAN